MQFLSEFLQYHQSPHLRRNESLVQKRISAHHLSEKRGENWGPTLNRHPRRMQHEDRIRFPQDQKQALELGDFGCPRTNEN